MIYVFVFIFGMIIGSFLNVVILRYGTGESIIYSGSRCFSCGKRLSWFELIPVLSFFIQKCRCRECRSKISWQYPIVEAMTGLVFLLIFWKIFSLEITAFVLLIYYWLISSLLIIISVYDFHHQIIPNKVVYSLIFLSLGHWIFVSESPFFDFLAGISFFAFFGLFWLVSKGRWMGLGDAKIALAAGWFLGFWNGLIAVLFSFWSGALVGIILLLFSSRNLTLKSRIPFGPFLSLGITVAFLFGNEILKLYLDFMILI